MIYTTAYEVQVIGRNMSWTGIKKAINRAGAQVMLKTGHIEETIDKDYEFEEKRFKYMESTSTKLQKELKHYLDSLRILTNAQVNVSEVLSEFYGSNKNEDKEYKSISQEYYGVMKLLNDHTVGELEQPFNQTVLNPIARFNSYYIEINEAIKKRNHKKLDYDAMKNKVRKLIEKPGEDPLYEAKLSQSQSQLTQLETSYETINDQLKDELPKLIDLRIPFLDPSFESFVKLQLRFFNENYNHLNNLQVKLDAQTRQDYINGTLDEKIDDVLIKMRELNITGTI